VSQRLKPFGTRLGNERHGGARGQLGVQIALDTIDAGNDGGLGQTRANISRQVGSGGTRGKLSLGTIG